MRTYVLGVGFDDFSLEQAAQHAYEMIYSGRKTYVVTPNPEIVWQSRKNELLRIAINNAGLVLPDGIGIVLGARVLGTPLQCGRVPGIDFIALLLEKLSQSGGRIFLLGAKPGVAQTAGENLIKQYPGLSSICTADGYFTDSDAIVEQINETKSDLLLVCLGAPKQEIWISENISRLNVPLCAGLGGSLDVFAGNVKRAPVFFQKHGLEWLYRIAKNPRRLKRSLSLPLFMLAVFFSKSASRPPL